MKKIGVKKKLPPPNRIPPLRLALIPILAFGAFCLLPRVYEHQRLLFSMAGAEAALLVFWIVLRARTRRTLHYELRPVKSHYIQLAMHAAIYFYWGKYWPEVYREIPLILAQVAFAYALDMMICWSRRDKWILGFGPVPIIFSTNLFLWFRDDWFWLQFLMVATGVLCKEFVKWDREGRRTHIFNPSAIALFVFSMGLLLTNGTGISWGPEISQSLNRPPWIYPEIFVLGLVVQGLFSVTLVTLSAAAVLFALNIVYTRATGVYYFVDSNIPVSVFIGLHLLVTDPATSPRRLTGKAIFGGLYGAAVFALYGILGVLSVPQFYDKLLCVPLLNLGVRAIDRFSEGFAARFHPLRLTERWGLRKLNYVHMAMWAGLFGGMMATGFVGYQHPGQNIAFWKKACQEGRFNSCQVWARALRTDCTNNIAASCLELGNAANQGRLSQGEPAGLLPGNRLEAGRALGKGCELGLGRACVELNEFVAHGGAELLTAACGQGDAASCFIMGGAFSAGRAVPANSVLAVAMFQKACDAGFARGCGRLGQIYMSGRGVAADRPKAVLNFDKGCNANDAAACYTSALLYIRGSGVPQDEAAGEARLRKACSLGMKVACQLLDPSLAGLVPGSETTRQQPR